MTARITTDIFCDFCCNWIHGLVSDRPKVNHARRNVKVHGWTVTRSEEGLKDMCPGCQGKGRKIVYEWSDIRTAIE